MKSYPVQQVFSFASFFTEARSIAYRQPGKEFVSSGAGPGLLMGERISSSRAATRHILPQARALPWFRRLVALLSSLKFWARIAGLRLQFYALFSARRVSDRRLHNRGEMKDEYSLQP